MRRITLETIYIFYGGVAFAIIMGATILSLFNYYESGIIVALVIFGFLAPIIWWLTNRKNYILDINKKELAVIIFLIMLCCASGFFHHDLPRGRDDMGYIAAAVKITESGSLSFTDIISRPYHPFRSIGQDVFTSQFLPGYNIYLAIFYSLGGLGALLWANAFILFIGLASIYYLSKRIASDRAGLIFSLIFYTSYVGIWFLRRTYSENLFLALFWFGSLLLIKAYQKRSYLILGWGLLFFSFLPFIRVEGVAFWAIYFILGIIFIAQWFNKTKMKFIWGMLLFICSLVDLYLFSYYGKKYGSDYISSGFRAASSVLRFLWGSGLIIIGLVVLIALAIVYYFFKKGKIRLPRIQSARTIILSLIALVLIGLEVYYQKWSNTNDFIDWAQFKFQYVFENLVLYMIIPFIILAYIGLYKRLYRREVFYIFLLALPSFIYLIEPAIAVDQPWFMRRFFPVFIPLMFLLSSLVIAKIVRGYRLIIVVLIIVAINLQISLPIISFIDHQGVADQMVQLSKKFTRKDLLVMYPGWHWQQWGYALHYIYGVNVLPNLDGFTESDFRSLVSEYDNVYIMGEQIDKLSPYYELNNLEKSFDWSLAYQELSPTMWITSYVDENRRALDLKRIRDNQRGTPPREISEIDQTFLIYRVKDPTKIITFSQPAEEEIEEQNL